MNVSTRGLFHASSLVNPVISAVLLFHSFTQPLKSIPKIGAFAVSTSCRSSCAAAATALSCLAASVTSTKMKVVESERVTSAPRVHRAQSFLAGTASIQKVFSIHEGTSSISKAFKHPDQEYCKDVKVTIAALLPCATPTTPTILFSASRRVVALTSRYLV